jgi:hypothetical protein
MGDGLTITAYEASVVLKISFEEFFNRLQNPASDEAQLPRPMDGQMEVFESASVIGLARLRGLRTR